jgi:hypothetical protein
MTLDGLLRDNLRLQKEVAELRLQITQLLLLVGTAAGQASDAEKPAHTQ